MSKQKQITAIGKWNYDTRKYDPYEVPEGIILYTYSPDLDSLTKCAGCFEDLLFGDGYTSRVLHTQYGMGYPVCTKCYEAEWEEERKFREK